MTRDDALALLKSHVSNRNLIKHMLAVEAVMASLAEKFGENEEEWRLAGLLHDIDYDKTATDPEAHSIVGAEILEREGLPEHVIYAVKVHNHHHGLPRKTILDKALYAVDPLTGLIVAAALIHPDKKLSSIDADFVLNRYKERSFARGADRDAIASCESFGMSLEEFVGVGLSAMQQIAGELGL
ncbi:MAG: HDIG domain-containing metalloprotein [Bacillota bacterium]|jgi:putative nucleotidyltransferase with HDIG domain|nr:HDIG domain-containing protein [Bacillota bacterium]